MVFLLTAAFILPMLISHNYYKGLETADLIELLSEATQKQTCALAMGESERTLDSYRELINQLQKEIEQRHTALANAGKKDASADAGYILPANT